MAGAFVGEVALLLVFGALAVCGAVHLAHPTRLPVALVAAGVRSPSARCAVACLVTGGELTVGGAGLVAVALGRLAEAHAAALVAGLLYAAFAVYAGLLVHYRPGAPCGCAGDLQPATVGTAARAAALSIVAASTAAVPSRLVTGSRPHLVLAHLCAVGLGLALWHVPASTAQAPSGPARSLVGGR